MKWPLLTSATEGQNHLSPLNQSGLLL